jgi:Glycosyltransferase sugar-binding region containing DXD motif
MIKKIHYCWFGSKAPASVSANVAEWKRLNPDFEFHEWNNDNIDMSDYAFGKRAIRDKRWGFLVDIIRPLKLFTDGGFYIDADVEIIRPLSLLEVEGDRLIIGYMYACALGTAIVYSPPGHPVIGAILSEYHKIREDAWPVSNSIFTDYFINHVPDFRLDGKRWVSLEHRISVYPKEFFEQPSYRKEQGMTIHHCSGSWMPENSNLDYKVTTGTSSHRSKWVRRKIRTLISLIRSEYLPTYLRAKLGYGSTIKTPWKAH